MTRNTRLTRKQGNIGCGMAISLFVGFIALFTLLVAIGGFIFMVAWNLVVPAVLGGPTLDYPQALALAFLINLIGSAFRSVRSR